ncbi:MAG TPA: polysaccharide biosynthesis tyrosine autokinase, partial [Thermoanaerobaculia bacterium]|nr:polysaccharide biosynthesis tyrosine autokinase [Thermoanaerobaculia bacterium]
VNSASIEYNNLRLEIETRRQLLDEMLRKQSETDVSSRLQATRESNVRVVDRALVPGGPFRPSLRRNVTLAGGAGLVLGFGLVLLLHYMDRTLKSSEEVERLFGVPVLAVIPDVGAGGKGYGLRGRYGYGYGYGYGERPAKPRGRKAGKGGGNGEPTQIELLPHLRPRMAVAEAYRALRTALLLSTAAELKVIVITSSIPGEGKTSTASNLAIVLAQLGRNVLLIDGDLRKSRLHELFGMSNRAGLVSYLTGQVPPEQIVLRTDIPNLYAIPAGPSPPNPSELLSSERMRDLVRQLRLRFDYVVIDSAPTLAVTDATILGSLADGVVLTACAGRVQRQEAKACRDRLQVAEVKVLGAVLNRFRIGGSSYGKGYAAYQAYAAYGEERSGGEVAAR